MKRLALLALSILVSAAVFPQQITGLPPYNQRALESLGFSAEETQKILRIQEQSATEIRRLNADLEVRKAELARLLLDEPPNLRMIERNLRSTADIEVAIRLTEIRRELAIREIVGTDRWARMLEYLRQRSAETAGEISAAAERRLSELQQAIDQKQREISELIQNSRDAVRDEEVRRAFQELARQTQELQRLLRERLQ